MAKETSIKIEPNAVGLSIIRLPDGKEELRRLNYNKENNTVVSTEVVLTGSSKEVQEQFKIQATKAFFT